MGRGWIVLLGLAILVALVQPKIGSAEDQVQIAAWAAKVKAVDRFGKGHREASEAVGKLSALPASEIPMVLQAMRGCSPLSANWFRAAVESSSQSDPGAVPVGRLEAFLAETTNDRFARSLAFDLIVANQPDRRDSLIAGFLNDPCLELRYLAVGQKYAKAEALVKAEQGEQALAQFRVLLEVARDSEQINSIAKQMKDLGEEVNLTEHYGFLTTWSLVGPFDNRDKAGFDKVYPPEEEVNLSAQLSGKEEETVEWSEYSTDDEFGIVDLNKAIGKNMGAAAYAVTEFVVDKETPAEIRIGTPNGNKVWVNGELIISNHVYHAGDSIDQFAGAVTLKPGANQILMKVCQNEQTDSWAQDWKFQLRVTDDTGKRIEPQP